MTNDEIGKLLLQMNEKLDQQSATLDGHTQKLDEHSRLLEEHSRILEEHSRILEEHSRILEEHSRMLQQHSENIAELKRSSQAITEYVVEMAEDVTELKDRFQFAEKKLNDHDMDLFLLKKVIRG